MGKCCQFFWVTVLDLVVGLPSRRSPLLRVCFVMSFLCYILAFSVLLRLGLVRKLVLILFRLCFFVIRWVVLFCLVSWFKIMVFCHLKLSWNRTCRLTGHLDFLFWLVCSLVGRLFSSLRFSSFFFFLRSSSPWLALRNRRAHLAVFSLLPLDDLTMPPYSLHPPPQ